MSAHDLVSQLRQTWAAFRSPVMAQAREASRAVWEALPEPLRGPDQVLGRHSPGCAATYGVNEACDFYCTACYLSDVANHTPPLPFAEVKAQLDRIRAHLGPSGNTQITSGEVTLLPCDELVRIVRYCRDIELSPMVMTNGQNLLMDPSYLERLVLEGGLDKIAIHIDTTEKGRRGLKKGDREADIDWIRDAFANLLRQTRLRTGRTLHAAQTFTVTERNLADVPGVIRWCLQNTDAFRMISFQPTAEIGRTKERAQRGESGALWDRICEGFGQRINETALQFGHPDCNTVAMMFVISWRDAAGTEQQRIMEVTRDDEGDRAFLRGLMSGGFAGFSPDGEAGHLVLARIFGRLAQNPSLGPRIAAFCAKRLGEERAWLPSLLSSVAARRPWKVRPFVVVVHNFMSAAEMTTPVGRARLAACAFRVPVDGRMVSMCELNAGMRAELNHRELVQLGPPTPGLACATAHP